MCTGWESHFVGAKTQIKFMAKGTSIVFLKIMRLWASLQDTYWKMASALVEAEGMECSDPDEVCKCFLYNVHSTEASGSHFPLSCKSLLQILQF